MIGKIVPKMALATLRRHKTPVLGGVLLLVIVAQWQWIEHKNRIIEALNQDKQTLSVQLRQHQLQNTAIQKTRLALRDEVQLLKKRLRAERQRNDQSVQQIMRAPVPDTPEQSLDWLGESIDSLHFELLP